MTLLRWRKILSDLWLAKFGSAAMIVAIAAGVLALGAVFSSNAILEREIAGNYLGTAPASATLDVHGGIDDAALAAVRALPNILEVTGRSSVLARMRVARLTLEAGTWPPPQGVLLERSSLEYFKVKAG